MARGKLRLYLGAAPGVGKTYAMLNEGWRRKERGTDVVVGWVQEHGRPQTDAQVRDLPIFPRKAVEYRGQTFEEMDLEGLLAAQPELVLVDELAHTNVPGSAHAKRWEDVQDLLDAGINVMVINVQAFAARGADNRRIYEELDDFQSRRPQVELVEGRRVGDRQRGHLHR